MSIDYDLFVIDATNSETTSTQLRDCIKDALEKLDERLTKQEKLMEVMVDHLDTQSKINEQLARGSGLIPTKKRANEHGADEAGEKASVAIGDLRLLVTSSLRYALNRSTYITSATADLLKRLPKDVWDQKTLSCAVTDLKNYLDEWNAGYKPNMDCDHEEWWQLYKFLKTLYEPKGADCDD